MQLNITSIENGYLIASQPQLTEAQIRVMQTTGQQPQPVVEFCENYEEVCRALKRFFGVK